MSIEMTVRYEVGFGGNVESVTGVFLGGVELGPLPSRVLPLKVDDQWRLISLACIVDIVCGDIPDAFLIPLQEIVDAIEMQRTDFQHEVERRRSVESERKPRRHSYQDTNWGHM